MKNTDTKQAAVLTLLLAGTAAAPALSAQPVLEEVIVTAQKKNESLQDAPISIVAFGSEAMEAKGIHNVTDLQAKVPNLQVTPHPNSATTARVFMRGVGNNDDQVTQDPSVAVYMDGIYIARSQGLSQEVADIAQIEVLRGPQGTLYGRNATGGAINVVTRAPDLGEFGASLGLTVGNRDYLRTRGSVNLPVGDIFAARLTYLWVEKDGFIDNPGSEVERYGDQSRDAYRLDTLWQASDRLQLRYSYDRSNIDDTPVFLAAVPLYPEQGERPSKGRAATQGLEPNDITAEGHGLTASWDLAENLTLKSITAYRGLDNQINQNYHAGVYSPAPIFVTHTDSEQEQWSQEFQLLGDALDGRMEYIAGAYYFYEEADSFDDTLVPFRMIDATGDGTADDTATILSQRTVDIENMAAALFGQATYTPEAVDSRLHITAGLRVSQDNRKATLNTTNTISNLMIGGTVPVPGTIVAADPEGKGDNDFDDVSPSLVLAYDLTDDVNVYGKLVKGYKTGGYNVRASSVENFEKGFDAENLLSYELGVKSQLWNDRIRLNAAVFRADYEDIQINVQSDPNNVAVTDVLNAGQAVIDGLELDLTAVLAQGLTLTVYYGYLDADYEEIIDATGDDIANTFRFINAPTHSYSVDLAYEKPLSFAEFSASVGYSWQDDKFTSSSIVDDKYIVGDYALLNARIGLSDMQALGGTVRVAAWGRNLQDEEHYVAHFDAGAPTAIFGEPRSYGVDFVYDY